MHEAITRRLFLPTPYGAAHLHESFSSSLRIYPCSISLQSACHAVSLGVKLALHVARISKAGVALSSNVRIRVWDLPTRLFHWSLLLCVFGLIVTGSMGGNWMIWHFRLGYGVLSLLIFRLLWGFMGGHWSRFSSFVPSPMRVVRYLRGDAAPGFGHNPMGALSVLAMLAVLLFQVGSGLFADDEIAFMGPLSRFASGEWVTRLTWYHKEVGKAILLLLIATHLAAIAFYRFRKKENLVSAMMHGDKFLAQHSVVPPSSDDSPRTRWIALVTFGLVVSVVAGLVIWLG